MVVEDTFVTTLESEEALCRAHTLLSSIGFTTPPQRGIPMAGTAWTTLEMKRGRKQARNHYCAADCPQRLRVEWDRGRITLANSMETIRKPKAPHKEIALGVARGVEDLLCRQTPIEDCHRTLAEMEGRIRKAHRRKAALVWIILLIFIAACVGLIIMAANLH